jgi:thioredoxin-like negative regulator of GroEL
MNAPFANAVGSTQHTEDARLPAGRRHTVSPRAGFFSLLSTAFCLLPLLSNQAAAQEVQWRFDYNTARQEAQQKNRPLVLDFGTENCFWCKKLDGTTFRDPTVAAIMNERFIPLKVNAEKETVLAEALRITSYPTLVLAAPDGKILGTLEGYVEATRFHEHLERVLTTISNPEWMTRDYQEAAKAIAASDYARAIALLKSITEDSMNRPVQLKARQLLADLEQQATGRLARAKQLDDKGQTSEALNVLSELLRAFAGTQAATEGGQMLTALGAKPEVKAQLRVRRARELLAQAREDYRTQQYVCCLDRCEVLGATYADLPEGAEATQLATEIKNNPAWLQQACETLTDRLSSLYMSLAETWLKKGQPQQAALCLERVVQMFPGTRQAEAAQVRLSAIQGRPTMQAEFKK